MLSLEVPPVATGHRFRPILEAQKSSGLPWDVILTESPQYVVTPTLGSVVPFWHLVVPREPAVNFRDHLSHSGSQTVRSLLSLVLSNHPRSKVLWFEHGALAQGSVVGCGTDYAHLHVILDAPFSYHEFQILAEMEISHWETYPTEDLYSKIPKEVEYYAFDDWDTSFLAAAPINATSQFFRRIVAHLAGKPSEWDYRAYAHKECVEKTLALWNLERNPEKN